MVRLLARIALLLCNAGRFRVLDGSDLDSDSGASDSGDSGGSDSGGADAGSSLLSSGDDTGDTDSGDSGYSGSTRRRHGRNTMVVRPDGDPGALSPDDYRDIPLS